MVSKKSVFLLKIIASIAIILLIFSFVNPQKIAEILPKFNWFFLPLLAALILSNIVLYVVNYWWLIGKKAPLIETTKDYLVVWAFSLFLPGKVGELGIIPILKKKHEVGYSTGTIATLAPKAILLALWIISFFFGVYFSGIEAGIKQDAIMTGLLVAITAACLLLLKILFYKKIKEKTKHVKLAAMLFGNASAIRRMFNAENTAVSIGIGVARFLCFFALIYFTFAAFGSLPEIGFLLMAIAVSETSAFLPISLSGLGVREATFTGIMAFSGTPVEISLGAALLVLLINYSIAVLAIIIWNLPKPSDRSKEPIR